MKLQDWLAKAILGKCKAGGIILPNFKLYITHTTWSDKAMTTHSSTLAWKIPWREESDRLHHGVANSQIRLSDFTFTFSCIAGRFFTDWAMKEAHLRAQSCPILWEPTDCSPPDSSIRGIFQARILYWLAISSFRGSSQPRDQIHVSCISCIGRQVLYHCATQLLWTAV